MCFRAVIILLVLIPGLAFAAREKNLPGCWDLVTEATQVCKSSGECIGMARFENLDTGENVVCNRVAEVEQQTWLLRCGGSLKGREFFLDFKSSEAKSLYCPQGLDCEKLISF